MVSIITQLLPVLSLLVATPFAIPMEYDSSPMAPPMAAGAGHDSAPAPSAPGGSYGSPAPALSGVEPVHAGASAAPTIAYNEGTQHSLLWASWSQSATAGAVPTHGSGSMPATDMNSCMQMCQATYGGPSHAVDATPPAATSAPSGPPAVITPGTPTDTGPAVTHTIIVAPTKGVLRFVPFSVNANVGDSLEFIWGAGPHSATLSQGQNVCNKSSAVDSFDSGKLNATATYTVKVNATTPNFHYCTVGMHCTAGMYGVVNPPTTNVTTNVTATRTTAAGPGSTAGSGSSGCNGNRMDCWVANWAASSPEASATVKAVSKACEGGDAWKWGAGLDMSAMLGDAVTKQNAIENVMYTRLMLSMNPSMLTNSAVPANFVSPPELKAFVTSSESGNSTAPAPAAGGDGYGGAAPSASADAASAGMNTPTSGASRLASPVLLLAAISAGIAILI